MSRSNSLRSGIFAALCAIGIGSSGIAHAILLNAGDTFSYDFDISATLGYAAPARAIGFSFYNQNHIDVLTEGERVRFDFFETSGGELRRSFDILVSGFTAPDGISFSSFTVQDLAPPAYPSSGLWGGYSDGEGAVTITMVAGAWNIESIAVGVRDFNNVQFNICSNFDAICPEQALSPIDAIPEPETYAMLLAGLTLLGFVARRRNQKEAAAA